MVHHYGGRRQVCHLLACPTGSYFSAGMNGGSLEWRENAPGLSGKEYRNLGTVRSRDGITYFGL